MPLDGLNAAAAAAILNQAGVDQATKTRGVIVSAFVPGPLGLAVPALLARNAPSEGGGGAQVRRRIGSVQVPNVIGQPADAATTSLKNSRLVAIQRLSYGSDADAGKVVEQQPPAGRTVALDSRVIVIVGAGSLPPPAPTDADLEKDITDKIDNSRQQIEDDLKTMKTELLDAIKQITPPPKSSKTGT
jgi:hypothetical protein